MGLDAIVYRDLQRIGLDEEDRQNALRDEDTGGVYFEDPKLAKKYGRERFVAIEKRLGNISDIGAIRSEIPAEIISGVPLLLNKVLSSGSHSGDVIDKDLLDNLEAEIDLLKQKTAFKRSLALEGFIDNMTELIEVARTHKNPIAFV